MPRTSSSSLRVQTSLRLSPSISEWVTATAKAGGVTHSEVIRRTLIDVSTCFGMARVHARVLDEDRQSLGLEWREYLLHLLARRFEAVQQHGAGFDQDPQGSAPRAPVLTAVPSAR